jgi:murein DD-endopeptidase MepM/ murein hydrolase activator NlpD
MSLRMATLGAITAIVVGGGPAAAFPGAPNPLAVQQDRGATTAPTAEPPSALRRAFPVRGATSYSAAHHDYPAADIFADCGTRVVSPITGTVLELSRVDRWDPSTDKPKHRGGKFFSIVGKGGVRYYGSHLRSVAGRVEPGAVIRAGQKVGRVGRSGNAAYTSCHLHFGISPKCRARGDWWIRRGVVSPYRFLRSWENGGNRNPRRAVLRWKRNHGCARSDVFG